MVRGDDRRRCRVLCLYWLRCGVDDGGGAKNPRRDLPIGIIASLIVCTVLYVAVAGVLTGIVPVVQYRADAQFLNAPVAYALATINLNWAAGLVSAGARRGHLPACCSSCS
jgi:hypothetical protein